MHVDLDEFVRFTEGMTFQDLVACLEKQYVQAVYGVILDVYPKDIVALAEQEKTSRLDMSATLYFDGKHHLQLR